MTVRTATAADWPALGARSRTLDTGTAVRCDPEAPYPDAAGIEQLSRFLTIYTNDTRTGWVGVRPDGVIKWLVISAQGGQAAAAARELLEHVLSVHGACRGRVVNPTVRTFLTKAGCTVDAATGWVNFAT